MGRVVSVGRKVVRMMVAPVGTHFQTSSRLSVAVESIDPFWLRSARQSGRSGPLLSFVASPPGPSAELSRPLVPPVRRSIVAGPGTSSSSLSPSRPPLRWQMHISRASPGLRGPGNLAPRGESRPAHSRTPPISPGGPSDVRCPSRTPWWSL